MKSCYTGLRT